MSENIPESIPTSSDTRSNRPTKRRALDPVSQQSAQLEALFANPDRALASTGSSNSNNNRIVSAVPEIVANVQGSSAGAGSGEFHVYKASRRREYERLRAMDEEKTKEEEDARFEREREERRKKDEEKTGKNRARREKMKARKGKKKEDGAEESEGPQPVKHKLAAANPVVRSAGGEDGGKGDGGYANGEVGIVIHDED